MVEELATTGTPLNVTEAEEHNAEAVTLSSGNALLLYTDGILEAGPSPENFLPQQG